MSKSILSILIGYNTNLIILRFFFIYISPFRNLGYATESTLYVFVNPALDGLVKDDL